MKENKHWFGAEFLAGGGSALVNIAITFPAHKVMLRQQVEGVSVYAAISQLKNEGVVKLYRGVAPPLLQKLSGLSIMFGLFHTFEVKLTESYPHQNKTLVKMAAGLLAGSVEALLTPFERMQTLLMVSEHKNYARVQNTVHTFLKIKKHYSIKEYYRGFTPILMRNGPSTAVFFIFRDKIKDQFPEAKTNFHDFLETFVSGALLGACNSTLFYPLNVIKSNMQNKLGEEYKGVLATLRKVYIARGRSLSKMYYGVHLNFSRALVSWGVINVSYEYFLSLLTRDELNL